MIHLAKSARAWGGPGFEQALKEELGALDAEALLLQQGLRYSSHALTDGMSVLVNGAEEGGGTIRVRVGIFYAGIIAGCNCADDPSPVDPVTEYLDLLVEIDKATAATTIRPAPEE
ncbi:MAG TPA: hypothetical protein ENK50_00580 [Sedimenticola sp.]|nr:hypothetical protein [Sedimenticola sp.]